MSAARRRLLPSALVVPLGAWMGAEAWLGVAESSRGPVRWPWQGLLTTTISAGSHALRSVTTTTGASDGVERSTGVVDFSRRDATEESVVRGPGSPAEWNKLVVVSGSAFERPGTDRAGSRRFSGIGTPLPSFVLPSFAPLTGRCQVATPLGGPSLRRVTATTVGEVAATVYQVSPIGVTSVRDGDQRSEDVWVDGSGRTAKLENLTAVAGMQSAVLTVTTFGSFGGPLADDPPLRVAAAASGAPGPATDQLAGCLLIPG